MTAHRTPHRLLRGLGKPLLGAFLALVGALAPIESSALPDPMGDMIGSRQAAAQVGSVISGMPRPCPTSPEPWDDAGQNDPPDTCILIRQACPVSLLSSTDPAVDVEFMPSITYTDPPSLNTFPDFCEARILQSQDPATYATCLTSTGYAVLTYQDGTDPGCRLVIPASCVALMHRITSDTCRAVQRRTWDCQRGSIPRNEFNTCFVLPNLLGLVTHPACGNGSPSFPISSCAEYVGQDFINPADSNAGTCPSYGLSDNPRAGTSKDYWCEYNTSLLEVRCHRIRANCPTRPALCIKRASNTGGCDNITVTINCRTLQEELERNVVTVEEVLRNKCYPCNVLPFTPPTGCPEEVTEDPDPWIWIDDLDDIIFRIKTDYVRTESVCAFVTVTSGHPNDDTDCTDSIPCVDPPRGVLSWESSHFSDHAIVNSPVIISIFDLPTRHYNEYTFGFDSRDPDQPVRSPTAIKIGIRYSQGPRNSSYVRMWQPVDTSMQFTNLRSMVGNGECLLERASSLRAVVQELWPDNSEDEAEIIRWFGSDALAWWNALSTTERQRRTEARGLQWARMLTPDQLERRRQDKLTEIVECNNVESFYNPNDRMWCRWEPPRSGYYLVVVEGAWHLRLRGGRSWSDQQRNLIDTYLQDPVNRANLISELDRVNRVRRGLPLPELTFADLGLDDSSGQPANTLARPTDLDEWLFTARATNLTGCDPIDLRIACARGGASANYTVTEPIGIMVHEMRASTVTPDT